MATADLDIPLEHGVITGAGAGIGWQIADHLTAAGVDMVINDADADALTDASTDLSDNEGDVLTVRGDVSDPDVTEELVERTVDEFGGVDLLVNNVGVAGPTKPCEELTHEEFMETLSINLGSHFSAAKAAIPHLREREAGRIINVSSMSGKRPLRDRTPYTSSKMGVIGFTRTLATELAEDGITVNAVCPGSVDGPRLEAVIRNQAESQDRTYDDVEQEFREVSPMNEFVAASDVADAVLFLCSERASRVTGEDLNVTAGTVMY